MLHKYLLRLSEVVVSSIDATKRQLTYFFAPLRGLINIHNAFVFSLLSLLALNGYAQDVTMPTVGIDGIDGDSQGDEILITIAKFVGRIAIWAMMCIAGFLAIKSILKSWNEQKQNDQGRWGAVIGDSVGSIILAILVIAIGTWVQGFLA